MKNKTNDLLLISYLKSGLDFKGRISRRSYFLGQFQAIFSLILLLGVILVVGAMLDVISGSDIFLNFLIYPYSIFALYNFWCQLPWSIKRLRDAGYNPWFVLLVFIPLGGLALLGMHLSQTKNKNTKISKA